MAIVFAVTKLFDDVVARFALDAAAQVPPVTPVPNVFGWRRPAEHRTTTHRVAWVPGDDRSGDLGTMGSARNPGRNPRPIGTLDELVTVYLEAVDTTAPEDERKQYEATRALYDAWLRAVYLAARGTFEIVGESWVIEKTTRRHGATIRVLLKVEAMVPDEPSAIAPVDTEAVIETHLEPNDTEGETDTVVAVP